MEASAIMPKPPPAFGAYCQPSGTEKETSPRVCTCATAEGAARSTPSGASSYLLASPPLIGAEARVRGGNGPAARPACEGRNDLDCRDASDVDVVAHVPDSSGVDGFEIMGEGDLKVNVSMLIYWYIQYLLTTLNINIFITRSYIHRIYSRRKI